MAQSIYDPAVHRIEFGSFYVGGIASTGKETFSAGFKEPPTLTLSLRPDDPNALAALHIVEITKSGFETTSLAGWISWIAIGEKA